VSVRRARDRGGGGGRFKEWVYKVKGRRGDGGGKRRLGRDKGGKEGGEGGEFWRGDEGVGEARERRRRVGGRGEGRQG